MKYGYLFIFLFLLACCKDQADQEVKLLYKQVMHTHDDIMPKTDDIHDLKRQLGSMLIKGDTTTIIDAIKKLDDADEAMMVWMNEFNQEVTSLPLEEQKLYYQSELTKITKVKTLMLEAINEGQQLIEKLKQ